MKIKILFFFFLSVLGIARRVQAQTATLSGTVTDAEAGRALTGATISVKGKHLGTVVQAYGSPAVGGLYYLTLTFDEILR